MKKILFVVDEKKMGGVSIVLENLFNELKDFHFDLLVLHNNGDRFKNVANVNIIYGTSFFEVVDLRLKELVQSNNIKLIVKKIYLIFLIKSGLISKKVQKEREKMLKQTYDVEVCFKDGFGTFVTAFGDSKYKIRWLHADYSNNDPGFHYKKTFIAALKKFDCFVGISKSVANKFNTKYGFEAKTKIIYNIIDENKCKPNKKIAKENYDLELVSVGRLHPIKGYDRVLSAINRLKSEGLFENMVFKIVGDGPQRQELQNFIKNNNLEKNVILYGADNHPWNHLQNGDLFILASYSEAFPTTVIESLLNHIPVFATKYASAEEILNNKNSILIENNDDDIYEELKKVILDKTKLKTLKKNVKNYKYDNGTIKKQLIDCLRCEDDKQN